MRVGRPATRTSPHPYTIHQDETWLLIAIKDDGSNNTPTVQTADALAEDGRGLGLVELIAHRWGHCGNEGGRTVWFELCWKRPESI